MYNIDKVNRHIELFIFDIFVAIQKIKYVVSKFDNAEQLLYDFTSWDSVIREFIIIGEASKYLLEDNLVEKEYQRIVDFRNQITHEYFGIDNYIVWEIVYQKLAGFENVIIKLIHDIEPTLKLELIDAFIEDNQYLDFIVEVLNDLKDNYPPK